MPRKSKNAEIIVGPTPEPQQDVNLLLSALDESRRNEIIKEERRIKLATELGKYRYMTARDLHRLGDGKSKMDLDARPFQKDILSDGAMDRIVYGSAQWGKANPLYTKVLTSLGWVPMGDLCVGDLVVTPDGSHARILRLFPQGMQPTYRITMADGDRFADASAEHLWTVEVAGRIRTETTTKLIEFLNHGETVLLPRVSANPNLSRNVISIRPIGMHESQCILIDHPDHLYLIDNYIPCHNTELIIIEAVTSAGFG